MLNKNETVKVTAGSYAGQSGKVVNSTVRYGLGKNDSVRGKVQVFLPSWCGGTTVYVNVEWLCLTGAAFTLETGE